MKDNNKGLGLWLWVGLAFGVLLIAWTAFFIVASQHRVEEVPLQTARPPVP